MLWIIDKLNALKTGLGAKVKAKGDCSQNSNGSRVKSGFAVHYSLLSFLTTTLELCNIKQEVLQLLAEQEDVAKIPNLYNHFFINSMDDDYVGKTIEDQPMLNILFGDNGGSSGKVKMTMNHC